MGRILTHPFLTGLLLQERLAYMLSLMNMNSNYRKLMIRLIIGTINYHQIIC